MDDETELSRVFYLLSAYHTDGRKEKKKGPSNSHEPELLFYASCCTTLSSKLQAPSTLPFFASLRRRRMIHLLLPRWRRRTVHLMLGRRRRWAVHLLVCRRWRWVVHLLMCRWRCRRVRLRRLLLLLLLLVMLLVLIG